MLTHSQMKLDAVIVLPSAIVTPKTTATTDDSKKERERKVSQLYSGAVLEGRAYLSPSTAFYLPRPK